MVPRRGHHDLVHQDSGDPNPFRVGGAVQETGDLGKDDSATVMDRLGHGQNLANDGLIIHNQIAKGIGGGGPD